MKKASSKKLLVILLLLTLICLGEALFANSEKKESGEKGGDHMAEVFSYKDKNKDGVISKDEWPYGEDYFKKIDKDGDGKLSLEEFKAKEKGEDKVWDKEGKSLLFKDKDNNGLITLEEWKGTPEEFQSFDADQNGSLSGEESKAALELGKEFHHGCMKAYQNKKMSDMDTDKNGSISLSEWKCSPKEFAKLDKDQNGSLSEEEAKRCCKAFKDFQSFHKMECHKDGKMGCDLAKFNPKEIFSSKDKNKDGMLSTEEWQGCPNEFKSIDQNGDGSLSLEEFEAKHQDKKMDSKSPGECPKESGEKKENNK